MRNIGSSAQPPPPPPRTLVVPAWWEVGSSLRWMGTGGPRHLVSGDMKVPKPLADRSPMALDVTIAAMFAVVAEVELRIYDQPILAGTVSPRLDSALVLMPLVPLAWRRAWPFAAVVAMPLVVTAIGVAGGTICFFATMLPFVLLMYAVAAWSQSPFDVVGLVSPLLLLAPMVGYDPGFSPNDWVFGLVVAIAGWAAGQGARHWRRQSQELAAALAAAEAGRDALAELAVAEERARIARELHDVVAHGVSVMVMQAGVARLDLPREPAEADAALARIEDAGRTALAEMRRLLGIWRDEESRGLEPQPGMARLSTLLEGFARAGMAIDHRIVGEPRRLSEAQDVSAYRVTGEALTNALRHGTSGIVRLDIDWGPDLLAITVSNPVDLPDGPNSRTPNADGRDGHGLVGIRERAMLFGGRYSSGVAAGRYVTKVDLPYDLEHQSRERA
jgi:signal transduction histidine kinase